METDNKEFALKCLQTESAISFSHKEGFVKKTILMLGEDDKCAALCGALEAHYTTMTPDNLEKTRALFSTLRIDLAVIFESQTVGFSFFRELRERHAEIPVLYVGSRNDEITAVKALTLGALDFIHAPVGMRELAERIRTKLDKRTSYCEKAELKLCFERCEVTYRNCRIPFSPAEFSLFAHLVLRLGKAVSRDELVQVLSANGELFDQTITTYVSRVKAKLKKSGNTDLRVEPVTRVGYRLVFHE